MRHLEVKLPPLTGPFTTAGAGLVLLACGSAGPPDPGSRSFERGLVLEDSAATSANVSIGDVNGDGHDDIVLVKGRHWPLHDLVLLGDGAGAFQPAYPVGAEADRSYSGELVDMDGDGDLDVVVSNDRPDPKRVHLNDGTGRFTVGSTFGRPEWATRHIAVEDLDGDGLSDVVLANRSGGDTGMSYLCVGVEGGGFAEECTGFARGSATTITPADFDGDGDLDLSVPHRDGGQSWVYLNDGRGGFEERRPFGPPGANIRTAKAGDFDGDGALDIVVIDEETGPAVFAGRPDGTFAAAEPLGDSEATPYAIAVADLDRNGRPDIIVGHVESRPIVYFNDGPDLFTPVPFGDDEGVAYGFAVGDLDEDGLLDIAMARSDAMNMLYFGSGTPTVSNRPMSAAATSWTVGIALASLAVGAGPTSAQVIRGLLVDDATSFPVPGASITLVGEDRPVVKRALSDSTGVFWFQADGVARGIHLPYLTLGSPSRN